MNITRSSSLSEADRDLVWNFLKSFDYIPYQQFPEYPTIEGLVSSAFIAREENKIVGWVQVIEKKHILAAIEFGPISENEIIADILLQYVARYYKKNVFIVLRWMPYCYSLKQYDQIYKGISEKLFRIKANVINWASKRISLSEPEADILRKFSENHRRNIKKGVGLNIECRVIDSPQYIEHFIEGYVAMYRHRKLEVDHTAIENSFTKLHRFLTENKKGFFMGAFKDDVLLGGLIIIYQGDTAFYHKGYIDHEQRQMPINHIAFYEAILHSKKNQMKWFDLGGYAVNASDTQLININKFKDGFKAELIEFPPSSIFGLNFISRIGYFMLSIKNKILKRPQLSSDKPSDG